MENRQTVVLLTSPRHGLSENIDVDFDLIHKESKCVDGDWVKQKEPL